MTSAEMIAVIEAYDELSERIRIRSQFKDSKSSARVAFQSIHPDNPPWTCLDFLGFARDSMDAAVAELEAANKDRGCGGLASLLLLDLIQGSATMAARIRAVINAAKNETSPGAPKVGTPPDAAVEAARDVQDSGPGGQGLQSQGEAP